MSRKPQPPPKQKPERPFFERKEGRRSFVKAFGLGGAALPLVVTLSPMEARAEGSGSGG